MSDRETRLLPCAMTPAERQEALEELHDVLNQLDLTEDKKKAAAKTYGELLKDLQGRKDSLRTMLRKTDTAPHGTMLREVEVVKRGDLLIRTDTDEVIDVVE